METFSALLALCARNSPVPGEFPTQRPVTRSFDVFFDLHPNKRSSKQWWGLWFETPSSPLWRHCNDQPALSHMVGRTATVVYRSGMYISVMCLSMYYAKISHEVVFMNKNQIDIKFCSIHQNGVSPWWSLIGLLNWCFIILFKSPQIICGSEIRLQTWI